MAFWKRSKKGKDENGAGDSRGLAGDRRWS